MSRVVDTDRGASALLARARELQAKRVRVGVLDDKPKRTKGKKKGSKLSLLEVAAVHEFGAPEAGIPQRSFIRATVDEKAADIAKLQELVAVKALVEGMAPEQALNTVGAKVAAMCQKRLAAGIAPALAPETIARKKSSKPLIDTGQLRSSITWAVEG